MVLVYILVKLSSMYGKDLEPSSVDFITRMVYLSINGQTGKSVDTLGMFGFCINKVRVSGSLLRHWTLLVTTQNNC